MTFLGKLADLLWLNVLTLICCIPVVTAGASLTAMHYVALKIKRNEEGYITRDFFKSFRQNFRQATVIWLLLLFFWIVFAVDCYLVFYGKMGLPKAFQIVLIVAAVPICCMGIMVFPVLARFDNSIANTIKNAFMISLLQFPKTILMLLLNVAPMGLILLSFHAVPVALLFGLSLPAYGSAFLYNKLFVRLEEQITGGEEGTGSQEDHWADCTENPENDVQNDR